MNTIHEHKSNLEKKIIFIMIRNWEGWHYLAVKSLSALLRGIAFMVVFLVWIVSVCLEQKKLESHNKICVNKDFFGVEMPPEDTKLLGFNQYRKSDKARSKYFIKKVDGCKDYPENHLQQK